MLTSEDTPNGTFPEQPPSEEGELGELALPDAEENEDNSTKNGWYDILGLLVGEIATVLQGNRKQEEAKAEGEKSRSNDIQVVDRSEGFLDCESTRGSSCWAIFSVVHEENDAKWDGSAENLGQRLVEA